MNRNCHVVLVLSAALLLPGRLHASEPVFPKAVPVVRYHLNPLELTRMAASHGAIWGAEKAKSELLENADDILEGQTPQPGWQVMQQIDLLQEVPGYMYELVCPRQTKMAQEVLKMGDIQEVQLTMDETHLVFCGLESGSIEDLDEKPGRVLSYYRSQLADTLAYLNARPLHRGVRIELLPSVILSTNARDRVRGALAMADTLAQQRDDELKSDQAVRAAMLQLAADAGQLCLSDAEALTLEVGSGRVAGELEVEVRVAAKNRSRLHQLLGDLEQNRNRSVQWLHPTHTGYFTVSLPCPDNVAQTLAERGHLHGLSEKLGGMFWSLDLLPVARLMDSDRQEGKLELLVQTVPCSDGSSAAVWIWPCRNGQTDTIRQVSWLKPSSREIAGHPVLQDGEVDLGDRRVRLSVVQTDQCIAAVIGTDAAPDMLEEILGRDYEESATARQLARSVVAADLGLDHPVLEEVLELSELLPTDRESEPVEARLKIRSEFDRTGSVVTLHVQKHASAIGMVALDASLEQVTRLFGFLMGG